ncbi:GMC family oxidoreductase [Pusillimonas minor]|uniref:GMC family oxidoreductase N-terminal domain-containing protein n=1 Tax=Pusillimonas minor TaxID=2697024 RepID=A0A842HN78_9BURK|nr:GMC family oxidoreductase N-terminal domain-containing protein [Pusillimonas minor]MBC2768365.1 GMC family oxidoreductase N-terminal domain-containing protein [Pusillimonas minor]
MFDKRNCDGKTDSLMDRLERSLISGKITRRRFMMGAVALGFAGNSLAALADELDAIRANQDKGVRNLRKSYDYIVVGTGSAACALVGRLASRADASILMIEAGAWDVAPSVLDPREWFLNLGTERDWNDIALPSPGTNNRAIPEHMGRVVGGGSSINATIWARPFRQDLDHWAQVAGDDVWRYEAALKVMKRMESWQGPPSAYRGTGGPVWCQPAQDPHPVAPAMLVACKTLGLRVFDDLNGEREEGLEGFALMNQIIKDGRRNSMARAYLYPVLSKPNVTLLTGCHVNRVLLSGDTATGVEISRDSKLSALAADQEVILCAGGINTPKLLMLSGIGDEKHLKDVNVKLAVHSPEVGQNFQDHLLHGGCLWEPQDHLPHRNSGANAAGFIKSNSDLAAPDINIVQIELPYASDVIAKQFDPPKSAWALCSGLVAPKSRGEIRLRSSKPEDRPVVDARFLSHPDDVKAMARGIEVCRDIGNSQAMKAYVKREVAPGKALRGAEMENFVRNGATTYFHQSGTCRMGSDADAVVDSRLRVNGVKRLRIADSSVMPRIASVATMATCVYIGEQMADFLMPQA